jgi:2-polyprenyl-3-methyl-5-hydroxy-6-metoxy-1,4-benzoquinol methylase
LVFVPQSDHLSADDELAHYGTHQNDVHDPRYRDFLRPAFDAIVSRVSTPARGLDFGCGPGPALIRMFQESGYEVDGFDPFYAPKLTNLADSYDFITVTEVAEHFRNPGQEFRGLWKRVASDGLLLVMTQHLPRTQSFASWYYHRDPTHIAFYGEPTFAWIANWLQARLIRVHPNVVLLQKAAS